MFSRFKAMVSGAITAYRNTPATVLENDPLWGDVFNTYDTTAGVKVDHNLALSMAAVYSCVNTLAQGISQLPLFLVRNDGSGGDKKQRAIDHPLYDLLHSKPNTIQTSYQFRQMLMAHLALRGNAYAEIQRNRRGDIIALWPWHPNLVRVETVGWEIKYWFQTVGGVEVGVPAVDVLHLRGLSFDGVMGVSPISAVRETFGEGYAAQKFGASFFKHGAAPTFMLVNPNPQGKKIAEIRKAFENIHTGLENAQRIAVLDAGWEPRAIGLKPIDAQFIETRKFNRTEIAGIFRVPAHFIGDLEKATFSNIENLALQFVQHTLQPWLVNWEQQMGVTLLTQTERKTLKFEHSVDGLLRGDTKSRWEAYTKAINWGVLSPNEVRDLEGRNPREGGDAYLTPVNMASTDDPMGTPTPTDGNKDTGL